MTKQPEIVVQRWDDGRICVRRDGIVVLVLSEEGALSLSNALLDAVHRSV